MRLYEWMRQLETEDHPYLLEVVAAGFSCTENNKLHYHNGDHLNMCLSALRECFFPEKIPVIYALAVAWHDAVYVPGASSGFNEELSCTQMQGVERYHRLKAIASGSMSPGNEMYLVVKQVVSECIRRTSLHYHLQPQLDVISKPETEAVLTYYNRIADADLSHLANPNYNGFLLTQAKLLTETHDEFYALTVGEFGSYIKNTLNFFDTLVHRKNIFRTSEAWLRYEEPARLNIKKFTDSLRDKPVDTCKVILNIASNYERL